MGVKEVLQEQIKSSRVEEAPIAMGHMRCELKQMFDRADIVRDVR
jgi:hypothetical protein